jgi:hypothetical protein
VTGCNVVNTALAVAPTRHPNLTVLDWQAASAAHPEYFNSGDVHYTPAGYSAWAGMVRDKLDAIMPEPATSTSTSTTTTTHP